MDPITQFLQSFIPTAGMDSVTDPNGLIGSTTNSLLAAGSAVGTAVDSAADAVTGGVSSLWASLEPWAIGIGVVLGLLLVVVLIHEVEGV